MSDCSRTGNGFRSECGTGRTAQQGMTTPVAERAGQGSRDLLATESAWREGSKLVFKALGSLPPKGRFQLPQFRWSRHVLSGSPSLLSPFVGFCVSFASRLTQSRWPPSLFTSVVYNKTVKPYQRFQGHGHIQMAYRCSKCNMLIVCSDVEIRQR